MASTQKNRFYVLEIGKPKSPTHYLIDTRVSGNGLQIEFDLSKTSDHKHNRGNGGYVDIYNLTPDIVDALGGDTVYLSLAVGYEDFDPIIILIGESQKCTTTKEGDDYITRVDIGEGYASLNNTKLKGYTSPGQTVGDVIEQIRKQMPDISRGNYTGDILLSPLVCGWRLSGTPREMLRKLCDANRLEYNINNNVLSVTEVNGLSNTDTSICPFITPETGLIHLPYHTTDIPARTAKDKRKRQGVQFRCLLHPTLAPGSLVRLEAPGWDNALYRVNTVRHQGSYRTNEWKSEVQCSLIPDTEVPQEK
ncbi:MULTISPECIES: hypothetical protein [unclassified Pseudomonas]|uniref:hypothetical protein n=1 Tax=unclassified Pseudomonas TaxID=196821 RepID=UPI0022491DB9|nr:hypothetical protein [Pseudomonas sp. DCB_BG]MCX2708366.1 hypothetical protein [Pseudomonas sp. DCB_BG]